MAATLSAYAICHSAGWYQMHSFVHRLTFDAVHMTILYLLLCIFTYVYIMSVLNKCDVSKLIYFGLFIFFKERSHPCSKWSQLHQASIKQKQVIMLVFNVNRYYVRILTGAAQYIRTLSCSQSVNNHTIILELLFSALILRTNHLVFPWQYGRSDGVSLHWKGTTLEVSTWLEANNWQF